MPFIQEQKFKRKGYEITADVTSIKFNEEERARILECQYRLQQTKPSTAIKQLIEIGSKVVMDTEVGKLLEIVLENIRKNERLGIVDVKTEIDAKVALKSAN